MKRSFSKRLQQVRTSQAGRLLLFLAVGGLNTLVGYVFFLAPVLMGARPSVAVLVATIGGVLFNFATTGRIVFGSRSARRLPLFVAVYAAQYLVNLATLTGLRHAGLNLLVAEAVTLPIVALLTYGALNFMVFPNGAETRTDSAAPGTGAN